MKKFLSLKGLIVSIQIFCAASCLSASTSSPDRNADFFEHVILDGDNLLKCFSNISARITGGLKNIHRQILILLSMQEEIDAFIFDVSKALGARHPIKQATTELLASDESSEITNLSRALPFFSTAQTIDKIIRTGGNSLIDFKSTVSTYVNVSTTYIATLLSLFNHPKLKGKRTENLQYKLIHYAKTLQNINVEILPFLEQLEDMYVRESSQASCRYTQRLKWTLQKNIDGSSSTKAGNKKKR